MSSHLQNYLRSNRKRLALSQDEVASLLGAVSGAKVCRYERFAREPNLETALAFEVIFQKPVKEIFRGLFRSVERKVSARAKVLSHKLMYHVPTRQAARKLQTLRHIAANGEH